MIDWSDQAKWQLWAMHALANRHDRPPEVIEAAEVVLAALSAMHELDAACLTDGNHARRLYEENQALEEVVNDLVSQKNEWGIVGCQLYLFGVITALAFVYYFLTWLG